MTEINSPPVDARSAAQTVSHMTMPEIITFCLQLRTKLDAEWQRVINIHAALIVVMIFFAGQENPFVTARLVVFAFYTFNMASSYLSLRETFQGLQCVNRDMLLFPSPDIGGASLIWLTSRKYTRDIWTHFVLLGFVWLVVFYLMILPLWNGRQAIGV